MDQLVGGLRFDEELETIYIKTPARCHGQGRIANALNTAYDAEGEALLVNAKNSGITVSRSYSNVCRRPTAEGTTLSSPNVSTSLCIARQPVQCPGTII